MELNLLTVESAAEGRQEVFHRLAERLGTFEVLRGSRDGGGFRTFDLVDISGNARQAFVTHPGSAQEDAVQVGRRSGRNHRDVTGECGEGRVGWGGGGQTPAHSSYFMY